MGIFSNLPFRKRSLPPEPAASTEPIAEDEEAATPAAALAAAPEPAAAAPSAADRAQAEELVRRVGHELPSFIAVAVVEVATGQILAGQWAGHSGGAVEEALAHADMVRQTNLAIAALHLAATEQLADVLVTLRHQLHLLWVLPWAGWLLYLAVPAKDTNPALVRAVIQSIDN